MRDLVELITAADPAVREGRMYEDFRAFAREIIRKYVEVTLAMPHVAQRIMKVIREVARKGGSSE